MLIQFWYTLFDGSRKTRDGSRKTRDGSRKTRDGSRKALDGSRKTRDGRMQYQYHSDSWQWWYKKEHNSSIRAATHVPCTYTSFWSVAIHQIYHSYFVESFYIGQSVIISADADACRGCGVWVPVSAREGVGVWTNLGIWYSKHIIIQIFRPTHLQASLWI